MSKKKLPPNNATTVFATAKLRDKVFRLLAKRDYSYHMLLVKLSKQGYELTLIHTVLEACKAAGYLDDNRFAKQYVNYRRTRGIGPKRITFELKMRGIADAIIAEHGKIIDNDWLIEMQMLLKKRLKHQTMQEPKQKAKFIRYFLSRGYTYEQISVLLNQHGGLLNDNPLETE